LTFGNFSEIRDKQGKVKQATWAAPRRHIFSGFVAGFFHSQPRRNIIIYKKILIPKLIYFAPLR